MTEKPEETRRSRRRGRWLVLALVLLVAAVGAARAVLAPVVKRGLERFGGDALGLPLRVGGVELSLFDGHLVIDDLVVGRYQAKRTAAPDPDTALVHWRRLDAFVDWRALLARRVHLLRVVVEGPAVRLERAADGRIEPFGPPGEPAAEPKRKEPAGETESAAWPVTADHLELRQASLRLVDRAGAADPLDLGFDALLLADVAITGDEIGFGSVALRRPTLRLHRDFAFGGAAADQAEEPAAAPEDGDTALGYRFDEIAIDGATFTLLTAGAPLEVTLSLEARDVTTASGAPFPLHAALEMGDGSLALDGRLGLFPPVYEGKLTWQDLPLPPLTAATDPTLAAWIRSCRAAGDLDVTARFASGPGAEDEPGMHLAGRTTVDNLLLANPETDDVSLGWKTLDLVIREGFLPFGGGTRPFSLVLERLTLTDPSVRFTNPPTALDPLLARFAPSGGVETPAAEAESAPAATGAEPAAAEAPPPIAFSSDVVELSGGTLHFVDRSSSPAYRTRVSKLALTAHDLRWPELRMRDARLTGVAPAKASFSLTGGFDGESGDFEIEVDDLALVPFDPYAASAWGYQLRRGEASLDSTLRIRGLRYETENELVLHKLKLAGKGSKIKNPFDLPLDLTLALLRDPNGNVTLRIPIAMDAQNVETDTGSVILAAIRQALVGAVTSPLRVLGAVIPRGGDEAVVIEALATVPGDVALAAGEEERVDTLADLLLARPMLAVVLSGRAGPADGPAIAERVLLERVESGEDLPELEGVGWLARRRIKGALEKRGKGEEAPLDPDDQALVERYVAAAEVPAARVDALAHRRAEAVRDTLVGEHRVDPDQVRLGDTPAEGKPGVTLEFTARNG